MKQSTLGIKLEYHREMSTGDIKLLITLPQWLTRTDGEFKWRVTQAIVLALTEKESRYGAADTPEGLEALEKLLEKSKLGL